ncbi:MAG: hypothetical protein KF851_07310 [Pirellulaceae bacterium]|nr:hypothetical protein [Pirellulaceae bacterium]
MARDPQDLSPVFRIDVAASGSSEAGLGRRAKSQDSEVADLLRQLIVSQERQNELLEDLVDQMNAGQRQRNLELNQWREANPLLARRCRMAAEALSRVQAEFLENLTVDVKDNYDNLIEGDFALNEFVDRYGPRLAHLNGVLQVLAQLSMPGNNAQV